MSTNHGEFICIMCGKEIDINKQGFQFHGSAEGGALWRHYKSGCELECEKKDAETAK